MAEVAPVGDEHALRMVLRAVAGHAGDVVPGVVDARQERVPAPYGRADNLCGAGLGDGADLLVRDLRVVLPVEQGDGFGEPVEDLGVFEGDVAPHHRPPAPGFEVAAQAGDVVGVHGRDADVVGEGLGPALAEVEGLVGADVEFVGAEQLQVVVDKPA